MIRQQILTDLKRALKKLEITGVEPTLEYPSEETHGDYSTNIAMVVFRAKGHVLAPAKGGVSARGGLMKSIAEYKSSLDLAQAIAANFPKTPYLEKIEAVAPGFVNFFLKPDYLYNSIVGEIIKQGDDYGKTKLPLKKKIVIEYISPNINKPLHVGHLRNGALGISISALYKALGWEVVRDCINNDRGIHIMKSTYGYLVFGKKKTAKSKNWRELLSFWIKNPADWQTPEEVNLKPDHFVGEYYVLGEKHLEEKPDLVEKELSEMLQAWEAEDKDLWKLWKQMTDWVHQGVSQTYKRFGIVHEKQWYEHILYKEGREVILEAAKKNIFKKLADGAIQADLSKYNLANKILVRKDGTSIYITFDIALTKHKIEEFKADKYTWIVGSDQIDHFKRLFAIFDLLGFGKIDKFYHLPHGMLRLPSGKMSSRQGNVVFADQLLDEMVKAVKKLMTDRKIGKEVSKKEKDEITEAVGIGALKYALLKVSPLADITFDIESSISIEGDSGPYLQYAYARCRSVLAKAKDLRLDTRNWKLDEEVRSSKLENDQTSSIQPQNPASSLQRLASEELSLLRSLYLFPEIVASAGIKYSPNLLCGYLFDLAKRYNLFYNRCSILKPETKDTSDGGRLKRSVNHDSSEVEKIRNLRLRLTKATAQILKNGLYLLGIKVVEKM